MTRILEVSHSEEASLLTRLNFLRHFRTEILGQRAVERIGDVCFGFFAFSVLLFTILAITYKPPDPWLQGQTPYNLHFNSVGGNSTFHPDDSVLLTGDDAPSAGIVLPLPLPTNTTDLSLHCDPSVPWDCSDLGLRLAVEEMNARHFPELLFYSYRIVPGGSHGVCDVAWRYRPRNNTTPRMYTDYRRVSVARASDCSFTVKKIGKWHSGVNARVPVPTHSPTTPLDSPRGKFLYYTQGNEYCKSMGQWVWGFLCALGEAQYLNRTFVLDLELCLSSEYSPSHHDEPGKDFRFYFDLAHLANVTPIIERAAFEAQWRSLPVRRAIQNQVAPADWRNDTHAVLFREFTKVEDPQNYWSSVCDGHAGTYIRRPWSVLWKSKLLMNIVDAICNKLEWDFDVVHVIRGYKAEDKKLWPHLDRDTSPERLIAKLTAMIRYRRKVYIASNEPYVHYFDRLREPFEVHVLEDFSYLWAEGSEWWNETRRIAGGGQHVGFDGYMKMIVDTEMLYRGKKRIETFNDLTNDCKNGAQRC